jgi:hypothetical protein
VKYWESIADNLKKGGWSLGWVSGVHSKGRTIWIVDVHRDGKRVARCGRIAPQALCARGLAGFFT